MGVVNTTPDSFSDGGQFVTTKTALEHAKKLIDEGADLIDIGGESTRPGAVEVSVKEEVSRTIPLIESIRQFSNIPISIDTSKPEVMTAAAGAGASIINDIYALRREGALEVASASGLPVCLMHMQGSPDTMQDNPCYESVIEDVLEFLQERVDAAQKAGIPREKIIIDPGFGFGKTLQQNLLLLKSLSQFKQLNCPILVGISRKSMLGLILDKPVSQRLIGSISAAVMSAMSGADIIRVHDVAETYEALALVRAMKELTEKI